jgi:NADH-quinone oxidoreductase subunit L
MLNLWLIPALPFAGFLINGLFGRRLPKMLVNVFAIGSVLLAFAWVLRVLSMSPVVDAGYTEHYFNWITAGQFQVGADFAVDRLTAIMLLVITGIGSLIHIYSAGYMAHEEGYPRFFAYLNLFMFFMLTLVLARNFLLLFVGWEGVGLCSYLLIGFTYTRKSATDAGNKAFIVNRIGDFGFLLAMFLIVNTFGSLDFGKVFAAAPGAQVGTLTTIALLLLLGACGKSAQFPLYVWLPDAMEGPTPVSALIHAATMVTAGVYLIARASVIFIHAPAALEVVAVIGLFTLVFAATIGMAQTDIKKVFAYSTVSQLGYMFLGAGVGAFSAGIYHLVTHAFFKALLFLGAGSVIHACGGEQDMRLMGGLRKQIPVTFLTLVCAGLAISGFPFFSGFYSKDAILIAAYHHAPWMYALGVITAGMTAFYVFRAIFLTFFGEYRGKAHPHESPLSMTGPLVILAILSVVGGYVFNVPQYLGAMFPVPEERESFVLMAISVAAGLFGILLAYLMYVARPQSATSIARTFGPLHTLVENKYYVDEIYSAAVVKPVVNGSRFILWRGIDQSLINNLVDGVGLQARSLGGVLRTLQSGSIRSYASWIVFGCVLLLFAMTIVGEAVTR